MSARAHIQCRWCGANPAKDPTVALRRVNPKGVPGVWECVGPCKKVERCQSSNDGDCFWKDCPQLKDYKSICPLYSASDDEEI